MTDHLIQLRLDEVTTSDVLAPDPLIVRLNKVFSWQQSASRWPYYLSRAVPGKAYTRAEIAEQIFGDNQQYHELPHIKGWLGSLYSILVDWEFHEVRVEGLGIFERVAGTKDSFRISKDGIDLARAYSSDRSSMNWKRVFAAILARNDVRLRCVLLHISRFDHYLTFRDVKAEDGFFAAGKGGTLRAPSGEEVQLFDYVRGNIPAYSFTPLLFDEPYMTFGPFLCAKIEHNGIRVPQHIVFASGRDPLRGGKGEPSGNNLRDYMKQALALFRDIGALVFVSHRQGWTLDRERCNSLFEPALIADLFGGAPGSRFLDSLHVTYVKFSDPEGLVRVADIRDYVCDALDIPTGERLDYFNQQIAYYMRPDVGKLSIGRTFHAQAGPSDCLFGDLTQEYVQFIFT